MKFRSIQCEALESRQLLAGDVCFPAIPESAPGSEIPSQISSGIASAVAEGEQANLVSSALILPATVGNSNQAWPFVGFLPSVFPGPYDRDLLDEGNGRVYAVRDQPRSGDDRSLLPVSSELYVFERQDDNTLVQTNLVELDFQVTRLIARDDSVIAIGNQSIGAEDGSTTWRTVVKRIGLEDTPSAEVVLDNLAHSILEDGDNLVVVSSDESPPDPLIHAGPVFVSPQYFGWRQPSMTLSMVDLASESLQVISIEGIDSNIVDHQTRDEGILILQSKYVETVTDESDETTDQESAERSWRSVVAHPGELEFNVAEYQADGDVLVEVSSLTLPSGVNYQGIRLAEDGKTAVVTGLKSKTGASLEVVVVMLDLSGSSPQVFETVGYPVNGYHAEIEVVDGSVLIGNGDASIALINTNQSIDLDSQSRVFTIDLPASESVREDSIRPFGNIRFLPISSDRVIVTQTTGIDGRELIQNTFVLSLSQLALISEFDQGLNDPRDRSDHERVPVFTSVTEDGEFNRFVAYADQYQRELVIASIDQSGNLSIDRAIALTSAADIDFNDQRLLVRELDRLIEVRLDSLESETVTFLGEPFELNAQDDVFTMVGNHGLSLDVLGNDQLPFEFSHEAQIVELLDAPEGVVIDWGGRGIFVERGFEATSDVIRFEYVLALGSQRSTASVELNIQVFEQADIEAAVSRVIEQAQIDHSVERDEMIVALTQSYTTRKMPRVQVDGNVNPLAGQYGVIVELGIGDAAFTYAANFGERVALLSQTTHDRVMALQLDAVDADGNPVDSITVGDPFFLQVTAQDLRVFGAGVFGVAFDLVSQADLFELTGELETLGEFNQFGGVVEEHSIEEWHGAELIFEHPGAAPQPVVRIGVRAIGVGTGTVSLNPAESQEAELTIRGNDYVVSPLAVEFESLELTVAAENEEPTELEPSDTNASGTVTPTDALMVVNFLGRNGSMQLNELPTLFGESEGLDDQLQRMHRLDTNADGMISARDALFVINRLGQMAAASSASVVGTSLASEAETDEEEPRLF